MSNFSDRIKKRREAFERTKEFDNEEKLIEEIEQKKKALDRLKKEKEHKESKKILPEEIEDEIEEELPPAPPQIYPKQRVNVEGHTQGISSRIDELNEKLDMLAETSKKKDKSEKHFALPRKIKGKLKKIAEKNKVMVVRLGINRAVRTLITDIRNGYVVVDGIPRNCTVDFTYLWEGKYPVIILPEWDINPIGTKDFYDAIDAGRNAYPIATVIRMLEDAKNLTKTPFEFKNWIWIGLAAIAVLYLVFGR